MASELGIPQSSMENEKTWMGRLLLSASSAWFLEGLIGAGPKGVSVMRVRKRLTDKISAYLESFKLNIKDHEDPVLTLVQYIYDTHLICGSFYHKAYQVFPSMEREWICFGAMISRSPHRHGKYHYSGLGTYTSTEDQSPIGDLEQLFTGYMLPSQRPLELLERICAKRKWQPYTDGVSREFLNIFRKSGENYYSSKRPDIDMILAREPTEYGYRYLLTTRNSTSELHTWEQGQWLHQYAALALMCKLQPLKANVTVDGKLARLSLDYVLPVPEENFLRMYAWPSSLSQLSDRWNFWIAAPLYPIFRTRLQHLGFDVLEVTHE